MVLTDLDAIMALEEKCFRVPWTRFSFESELMTNMLAFYTVMVKDDVIIGYGGYWQVIDEAHVTNIAVDPDFRRLGFGRRLMLFVMKEALKKGVCTMTLEVRASNLAAIHLYEQLNFKQEGVRKGYYQDDGEDAIIMWADLRSMRYEDFSH
jgi:ribosomal-protein-alanine N-acetyltransferase